MSNSRKRDDETDENTYNVRRIIQCTAVRVLSFHSYYYFLNYCSKILEVSVVLRAIATRWLVSLASGNLQIARDTRGKCTVH